MDEKASTPKNNGRPKGEKAAAFKNYLKRAPRRYFVDAMNALALGLFASLIVGVILAQLAKIPFLSFIQPFADMVAATSPVVGAAVGAAIAWGLKSKPLVIFSSTVSGAIGYSCGGPVGAYVAALVGAELGNLVAGKTPVDIVLVPIVTIVSGGLVGKFVGPGVTFVMDTLGAFINWATARQPIPMGIVISVVMGWVLTSPISSAALSISLNLSGLAAGAACVGCATQMVGFAVASYRENKLGGLISQGLGTAKLQLGNIMKKPAILLPTVIASAILGPISTAVFGMTNSKVGAGMGTSALVGQLETWASMSAGADAPWQVIGKIVLMHFILPAALTLGLSELFRRLKWIKFGDMQLELK